MVVACHEGGVIFISYLRRECAVIVISGLKHMDLSLPAWKVGPKSYDQARGP